MSVIVIVPATTANLGPGFDCIGAALSLYNRFEFAYLPSEAGSTFKIEALGLEAERVKTDASNLAYQAFLYYYQKIDKTPPSIHLTLTLNVPLSRGLGSSATAIVGGLVGANELAGNCLSHDDLIEMATELEGHPDNVVPALIGGCRLAASKPDSGWTVCDIPWHSEIVPIVAVPNFELSTADARRVLPLTYDRRDTIFNAAHLGLLLRGLQTGQAEWLTTALQDRIHQPYRQHLIPGYTAVQAASLAAGAYGLVISGAGPTLLALAHPNHALATQTAMQQAWEGVGMTVQTHILPIDTQGTVVQTT